MKVTAIPILILALILFVVACLAGTAIRAAQEEIKLLDIYKEGKEIELPKPDFAVYNQHGLMAYHNELKTALINHPPDYIYTLRERALKRAEDLLHDGQTIHHLSRKPLAFLNWGELSNAAGTTDSDRFGIYLNEILFIRNPDEFIDVIIPHEVSHLIHQQMYDTGDYWHLPDFHNIMKSLVGFSTTYHNMDIQPVCDFLYELTKAQARLHPCDNCTLILAAPFCKEEMIAIVYQYKILEYPYGYVVEELQ